MKHLFSIFAITGILLLTGCYSSLDRKPVKKAPPKKQIDHRARREKSQDRDVLFDAIFHRNPQRLDGESKLSERERELLRQHDISQDPAIRELHRDDRKKRQQGSDWVFGTQNGSYF